MGWMCRELCRWEVAGGGTSGVVSDNWETFRPDNLESEVGGGTCGMTLRGYVSKRDVGREIAQTVCVTERSAGETAWSEGGNDGRTQKTA